jgi:hypothetical protein
MGATRRLVGSLGLARPTEPTLRAIQLATDGNPLFIREVVREADRSGVLHVRESETDAGYRGDSSAQASAGLRAALAARISRLDPACRAALRAAAFIGDRFGALALSAVCGVDTERIRGQLQEGRGKGVSAAPDFRFDHPLIREILCEHTGGRAPGIHRDVAAVLEDLSPPRRAARTEIAHHLVEAGPLVEPARVRARAPRRRPGLVGVRLARGRRFYYAAVDAAAAPGGERARPPARRLRGQPRLRHGPLPIPGARGRGRCAAGDDVGLAWSLMYLTRARLTFPVANWR